MESDRQGVKGVVRCWNGGDGGGGGEREQALFGLQSKCAGVSTSRPPVLLCLPSRSRSLFISLGASLAGRAYPYLGPAR